MNRFDQLSEDSSQRQIKVYIRNRPLKNQFTKRTLKLIDHGVALNFKQKIMQLYFDGVFDEAATQQAVFRQACCPLLDDVLNGNHASLFVYGQTGTGKTYTMGTLEAIKREDQGLIPLSLNYLLGRLKQSKPEKDWSISLSFMQIYMEDIYDLLNPRSQKLKIREDHEYGQIYVQDLVIVPISNYKQSIDLINAGLQYRKTGNQKMNQLSSRSHTILTIYISQKISDNQYVSSTLSLIDLAGSERVKKTNSTDIRLKQAKFINSSLSALGNVISELSFNDPDRFIPYRSSKLTRILKNSLTGKSKIAVICTLQTSESNLYETYSTLLFADRCKAIRFPNQPAISVETFEELDLERDLKVALQNSKKKEQEYLNIIKTLQGSGKSTKETQRQNQLSSVIESVYKLFAEINDRLKHVLEPQSKNDPKRQMPKVTSTTTIPAIKTQITKLAQETIDKLNVLTSIAFGEGKSQNSYSGPESQALLGLMMQSMRLNVKLQESILIKDGKQGLQKQIAIEQFEKQRKQQVINKLKHKKLTNLSNHLQQIWTQNTVTNPIQSLLSNIRRNQISFIVGDRTQAPVQSNSSSQFTSPKQFLKMLTRQESEKKQKQIYIDEGRSQDEDFQQDQDLGSSKVKYFQQNSPMRKSGKQDQSRKNGEKVEAKGGNSQIKKLLQSLIVSKSIHQEKKRGKTGE